MLENLLECRVAEKGREEEIVICATEKTIILLSDYSDCVFGIVMHACIRMVIL